MKTIRKEELYENLSQFLKGKGIELIGINGGHHFDGDYEALAQRILTSLQGRLAGQN